MNWNGRRVQQSSPLKALLVIFLTLGIVAVTVLAIKTSSSKTNQQLAAKEKPAEPEKLALAEKQKTIEIKPPKAVVIAKQKDTAIKKEAQEVTKPLKDSTKLATIKPIVTIKDTSIGITAKPQKKTRVVKQISNEKMVEILNKVKSEKQESNNSSNCISIQIIDNSNSENGSKIANYLRQNGFVISGREVVKGSLEGIRVHGKGVCLTLQVGDL